MSKYTQKNSAIWVQVDGPNTEPVFLGCHDMADIAMPLSEVTSVLCRKPDGKGWDVVAEMEAPPARATATITALYGSSRDWLERVKCPYTLFLLQSSCGRPNDWGKRERYTILKNTRNTSKTKSAPAHHTEDGEINMSFAVSAEPVPVEGFPLEAARITTTEVLSLNGIAGNADERCFGDCGDTLEVGDQLAIAADSAAGPATGNILFSTDQGDTWAAGAADPFGAGLHSMAITRVRISNSILRTIASEFAPAGAQGHLAYSDNAGTTWTTVNIGGAAAGHGANQSNAFYQAGSKFILLASAEGYIYKSTDGGVTWTAKEAAAIAAGDYNCIDFADDMLHGAAAGVAGVVALTDDGGESWYAATVPVVAVINAIQVLDDRHIWVGTAGGETWYSNDFGLTWTERIWGALSGTGQVRDIRFADALVGYLIHNTAGPVGTLWQTINGGWSWEQITLPTNVGLNQMFVADANLVFIVGEAQGGTGVIIKVEP